VQSGSGYSPGSHFQNLRLSEGKRKLQRGGGKEAAKMGGTLVQEGDIEESSQEGSQECRKYWEEYAKKVRGGVKRERLRNVTRKETTGNAKKKTVSIAAGLSEKN